MSYCQAKSPYPCYQPLQRGSNQPTNPKTRCRFHRAPPPRSPSPAPMESDDDEEEVVSEGVSDASEDSQVDESMEPPEDMVAAAWLGWLVTQTGWWVVI